MKLNDEAAKHQPKKKSFLSRFGDSNNESTSNPEDKSSHRFHLPGRKRGQSGTGSELGEVKKPTSKTDGGSSRDMTRLREGTRRMRNDTATRLEFDYCIGMASIGSVGKIYSVERPSIGL